MIYTITFNPAIDHIVRLSSPFIEGGLNRSSSEDYFIGGKGINVSIVLKELGFESTALGFLAGFTGREILRGVEKKRIIPDFVMLDEGNSRINVKLKGADGIETEINSGGPDIPDNKKEEFMDKFSVLKEGDYLIISGSAPKSLGKGFCEDILKKLEKKNVKCVVDTSDTLADSLKYRPFLIKPNLEELESLIGRKITGLDEIESCGRELQARGAQNVLVSMAEKGAVLLTSDGKVIPHESLRGEVKNSVGAGDSMVAGFIAGYIKTGEYSEALKLGIAAGCATAFSDDLATGEYIGKIYERL